MGITALTVIVLITVLVSLNALNNHQMKEKFMYSPYLVKHERQGYRVLSHLFIHADAQHLVFNMLSLYILGFEVEKALIFEYGTVLGELHMVSIYLIGGLFATIVPFYRNQDNSAYRSLGASGAVSAAVFAFIIWNPTAELGFLILPFKFEAFWFGLFYIGYELYMDKKGNSGIAHDAHLGGALLGILYVLIINPSKGQELIEHFI